MFIYEDLDLGVRIIVPRQSDERPFDIRFFPLNPGIFARPVINFDFVYTDTEVEELKMVFRPRMHLEVAMTQADIEEMRDLGFCDPVKHKGQIQWFTPLDHFYEKNPNLPFNQPKGAFPGRALLLIKHWGDPNVGWG